MKSASHVLLQDHVVTPIVSWSDDLFRSTGVEVFIKQDYLNHPTIQGNKFWKLLGPLKQFAKSNHSRILSFGGAYSNHLLALSHAAEHMRIPFIAMIRGEQPPTPGYTLRTMAAHRYTELVYLSRSHFSAIVRDKQTDQIPEAYRDAMIIPEGGSMVGALEGLEVLSKEIETQMAPAQPHQIWLGAGTGGTTAGLLQFLQASIQLVSVPVLRHEQIRSEIESFLPEEARRSLDRLHIIGDAHWGGYAKVHQQGIQFMNEFFRKTTIPLDPIYNAKVFYAFYEAVKAGDIPSGQRILLLHTGRLQGLEGYKESQTDHGLIY